MCTIQRRHSYYSATADAETLSSCGSDWTEVKEDEDYEDVRSVATSSAQSLGKWTMLETVGDIESVFSGATFKDYPHDSSRDPWDEFQPAFAGEQDGDTLAWRDEVQMKRERQYRLTQDRRSHLHGKRGRHLCNPGNTLALARFEIVRDGKLSTIVGLTKREYEMTEFDFAFNTVASIDKEKRWEYLIPELVRYAKFGGKKRTWEGRQVYMFDVPISGVLIDEKREASVFERRERRAISMWKKVRPGTTYYEYRAHYRPRRFSTIEASSPECSPIDETIFMEYVRPFPRNPVKLNHEKEEYASVRMSFHSTATVPVDYTNLRTDNLMDEKHIEREIASARGKQFNMTYYLGTPVEAGVFSTNHFMCWASQPPPHADYDDWYMEIDLGMRHSGGQYVRAIVIQGQLPQVESFPHCGHFPSVEHFRKYNGPIFPVLRWKPRDHQCWVERFEVMARSQKGAWFSLGVFRGNSDCWNQVRVDLPSVADMKLRFLRIRPLSKNKQGFHGLQPAFRIGVVSLKVSKHDGLGRYAGANISGYNSNASEHTYSSDLEAVLSRSIDTLPRAPHQLAEGFVRYEIMAPQRDVHPAPNAASGETDNPRRIRSIIVDRGACRHFKDGHRSWRKVHPPALKLLEMTLAYDRDSTSAKKTNINEINAGSDSDDEEFC